MSSHNTENSVYLCDQGFQMLLYFTVTFSAQSNRKDGEENNVLLMTNSPSQRSQSSLLFICMTLALCNHMGLHQHQGGTEKQDLPLRVQCFTVITDKCAIANIQAQSTGDLGKQIAFICASACFESHNLISNSYCCNSLEDLLKLADSGFLAFIRMPNLPPSTSSEGS